jgi:hypothetical protein
MTHSNSSAARFGDLYNARLPLLLLLLLLLPLLLLTSTSSLRRGFCPRMMFLVLPTSLSHCPAYWLTLLPVSPLSVNTTLVPGLQQRTNTTQCHRQH